MFNTPKDVLLIAEAYNQILMSDEDAAKKIADKIKGTPNLSIPTIKQYVAKYLGMVGKSPTDVDHVAANVYDILQQQGLVESKKKLSPKQKKIAAAAEPKDEITGADFAALKKKKAKNESLTFRELYASVIND